MKAKPPVRLITIMWGNEYCDKLLNVCLPAILAPGNLPALAKHFACELVLVTEERLYDVIENSDIAAVLKSYCTIRYVRIDDLVEGNAGYGMSLTYALHRGFDDLGEAMCDHFLIFFNADFILADGSYEILAKHMLAGERLIFSPSYCVNSGQVTPMLTAAVDPETHVMSIPKREMARMGLAYRHNTVRAKTINQPVFHMHVTDQFYWYVDDHTRLGRQLPIAIVCMKPQQVYTDPVCFWDYATLSMASPTANRFVLGDSDDFLMIELRDEHTFRELMTIGHTTPAEIAEGLGGYMTEDQIEMGKYPLVLHSRDLPENYEAEKKKFDTYMDKVYALLPKKLSSYINHRFWVGQVNDLSAARAKAEEDQAAVRYRESLIDAALSSPAPAETGAELFTISTDEKTGNNAFSGTLGGRIYKSLFGLVPRVTKWHPFWADLHSVVERIDAAVSGKLSRILIVAGGNGPVTPIFDTIPGTYLKTSPLEVLQNNIPLDAGEFDLCFCELNWMDCAELKRFYHHIRSRVRPGGKIIVYCGSGQLRGLQTNGVEILTDIAPIFDTSIFYFGGSHASALAADEYRTHIQETSHAPGSRQYLVRHAKMMFRNAWRARWANNDSVKTPVHKISNMRTSMTIEISI